MTSGPKPTGRTIIENAKVVVFGDVECPDGRLFSPR